MKQLASLNKYFWKYKHLFLTGILFIFLSNYFRILAPQITSYIVNNVIVSLQNGNSPIRHSISTASDQHIFITYITHQLSSLSFEHKILYAGILLFIIAIISGLFMFLMRQTIIVMSRHIEYEQKNEIYQHYQMLDISFYKKHATGDLMNRISEDVSRVRMYTGPAIMYFINLAAVIGFSIYFMVQSDLTLALVALCPLPILALIIYFVNSLINKKSEKIQSTLSDLTSNAQESYSGIRVIKSFAQESSMIHYFKKCSEDYKIQSMSLARTEAIYFPSMGLIIGLSTLITIMVGCFEVVNNVPGASVGKIAEFVLYIQMLTFPVSAIGWTASMTQRAVASQKRINEFLKTTPKIINPITPKKIEFTGNIIFDNVNFSYVDTNIHAIKNVNIIIKKGEKIAIVGKTGCGKTTFAQLLLRMYDADNGMIKLDNVPIQDLSLTDLRNSITYVSQEVFLFSDTIFNNIIFGDQNASIDEVIKATKDACIYDEIMSFPDQFNTLIGERGITLSGGQKQRISIARAMIKKNNIVLFDDCLSAVDAKTENIILQNLNFYLQNKTSIVITHRIFNLLHFDKIIVLDNGSILESGTHQELISQNGIYFNMYNQQQQSIRE